MQTEEFYNKIRENLDNSDFTPEWNKSEVWQRVEQRRQKKSPSIWWKMMAASIVVVGLLNGYLLLRQKPVIVNASVPQQPVTKSTQVPSSEKPVAASQQAQTPVSRNTPHKRLMRPVNEENDNNALVESELPNEEFDNMITTEGGEQEFSYTDITTRNEPAFVRPVIFEAPIIFRPKVTDKNVAPAPAKRERVAILEIPEDQQDYVIAPKEKKKSRQARLAKQVQKTPETSDPKPSKIWAFVKQSFKNETAPADSTIK